MLKEPLATLNKEILGRLVPLGQIDDAFYEELFAKTIISNFSKHENIIKSRVKTSLRHYLIEGDVEIRHSFSDRRQLSSKEDQFRYPLEEIIKEQGSIKARDNCTVLIVNLDHVEELLKKGKNQDYKVLHNNNILLEPDPPSINEDVQDGWEEIFLQSLLSANLSPVKMHRLFCCLKNRKVKAGEEIIRCQTPGDNFYVIKEGFVSVITETTGSFQGEIIQLGPGDYFGDEALIADTSRNATVVMSTDGVLGHLSKPLFIEIIRDSLVNHIEPAQVSAIKNVMYLDVRLSFEYDQSHRDDTINIPVSHLRKQMAKLDNNSVYVITPEGGRRSDLATYLLKQAGFEAYLLKEQVGNEFAPSHSQLCVNENHRAATGS